MLCNWCSDVGNHGLKPAKLFSALNPSLCGRTWPLWEQFFGQNHVEATSLRTGHKATTHGSPPVVREVIAVTKEWLIKESSRVTKEQLFTHRVFNIECLRQFHYTFVKVVFPERKRKKLEYIVKENNQSSIYVCSVITHTHTHTPACVSWCSRHFKAHRLYIPSCCCQNPVSLCRQKHSKSNPAVKMTWSRRWCHNELPQRESSTYNVTSRFKDIYTRHTEECGDAQSRMKAASIKDFPSLRRGTSQTSRTWLKNIVIQADNGFHN